MISGYQAGSDITLMNTLYLRPKRKDDGKYTDPVMNVLFKDNITGEKHIREIKNPTYRFYMANDDVHIEYAKFFIREDQVHPVEVPYANLEREIAKLTGNEEFYYDNVRSGNKYSNKALHTDPRIFRSDTDIQDHYRARFDELYSNSIKPITKAYLDIETKGYKIHQNKITGKKEFRRLLAGDFPEPGEAPINAVTYVSEKEKKIYTFLLRDPDNPQMVEFEKNVGPDMFNRFFSLLSHVVGGRMKMRKSGLDQYQIQFIFYDEDKEIDLIADLFNLINVTSPDFLLVWNMAFDIPYFIERIKKLGYDPKDIICDKSVRNKECEYFIDERNKNDFAERGDYANITSKVVYLDQMIQFASRRKGQSAFTSFALNYIGEKVARVKKLDYSDLTSDLMELEFLDYERFVFYNIIDTIVQKCIEDRVQDINYIFSKCLINDTRYQKGHRQTVYLTNRAGKFFKSLGFVIGNNQNKNNTPEKFGGGMVGAPDLINDYAKMIVNATPILCYNNLDDFDFKSLYPSLAREFNLAPNTQIGRLYIPEKVWAGENLHEDDSAFSLTREGLFMENLQSHDYLNMCHRWFNLANYETLIDEDMKEFFTTRMVTRQSVYDKIMNDGYHHPIIMKPNDERPLYHAPITMHPIYNNNIIDMTNEISQVLNNYKLGC